MFNGIQELPDSTQLWGTDHDSDTDTMRVAFRDRKSGTRTSTYEYRNVTAEMHAGLRAADSAGHWFNVNIKAKPAEYPYRKVEG